MSGDEGERWLALYDEDPDVAHLDRAITDLEAAIATGPADEARVWWPALGLAYQERAARRGDPADWDRAIRLRRQLVDVLPPGPQRDEVLAVLCWAYLDRDEPGDLDRVIETGGRAESLENPHVRLVLACAYAARWDTGKDPADLDRAIERWRRALTETPEPGGLAACGWLLGQRAEVRDDPVDTADAIAYLEQAMSGGEACWWPLGLAHHLRWRQGGDRADLERAVACLDRGLAEMPEPDRPAGHRQRLVVTKDLMDVESAAEPGRIPPSAACLLDQVAAAQEVWAGGAGGPENRVQLAATMAGCAVWAWQAHPDRADTAWLAEMVDAARKAPELPPGSDMDLNFLTAVGRFIDEARAGSSRPGEALELLLDQVRRGDPGSAQTGELQQVTSLMMAARAVQNGDRRMLRTALDQLRASPDPATGLLADALDLIDRAQRGDVTVHSELRDQLARMRGAQISYVTRQAITPLLAVIERATAGTYQPVDRTPVVPGDMRTADLALRALFGAAMAAITRHDVAVLREVAGRLDELLTAFPAGHVLRTIAAGLGCLTGVALLRDEPGDQDACRRLLRWTEDGLGITGGVHHPRWSTFALARAEALRQADGGDRAESRRLGLAALRGYAWQVLLQSGTDDAVLVAADAGRVAHGVAGWCLADGALDDLVAALDAGRGLVLSAATASRTIADRLVEAGHPDLAGRWRSSAGYGSDAVTGDPLRAATGAAFEVPDDLRTRVLYALGLSAPEPASPPDLRAALAAAGADALVYLMPSSETQPGAAVVVPAAGEMSTLVLPGLIARPGSAFDRFTSQARDAGPIPQAAPEPAPGTPDNLCRWAWSAAMGPLLRNTATWQLGRPVRLVLVPTGPLSAVPWHAAYRTEDTRRHYAIEDAVISYAVSGRAFSDSAREPARDVKSVLIVGDPTGDLPFAGVEAGAIGRAFYPDGAFLGVAAAERGTPQQVLDWVTAAAPGPSLLHLACHGHADPAHPADACLRLAGGDLTARRLLEASRTAELEIERVFLAACSTGTTGADHDEAFSLATAFLAAGARTVIGSLWRVPDAETSLLMFLVHHFLNIDRCPPVDALHRAQRWMIDSDRQAPAGMPPDLARHCRDPRTAEPRSWAAFTHHGR
jgi:CHAT domain-containing protein